MALFNGYGFIGFDFYRIGDGYKTLKNEIYELYTIDGKSIGVFPITNEDGKHHLDVWESGEDLEKYLPAFLKEKIFLNNADDIKGWLAEEGQEYATDAGFVRFSTKIPLVLKQITAEPGYKKNNLIIDATFEINISYNESTGEVTSRRVSYYSRTGISNYDGIYYYTNYNSETDKYEEFTYPLNSLKEVNALNEFYQTLDYSCINTNSGTIITDSGECTERDNMGSASYLLVPYFEAEKGTVKFEIANTVNGLAKYNASKDKNLEYKIDVKNVGDIPSYNNSIVTYIPEEITVDEDNISDDGVYNETDHTITWKIDLINEEETVGFSYKALAPDKTQGAELIGKSSIQSDQVAGAVFSTNTVVTLDKVIEVIDNPGTGTMIYIANTNIGISLTHLIMFMVVLVAIILFLATKLKRIKRHN